MKIFEVAGEGKLHGLTVMSLDAFVNKEDDVEESQVTEIDRRGFLKGMGAAAVAGAGLASPGEAMSKDSKFATQVGKLVNGEWESVNARSAKKFMYIQQGSQFGIKWIDSQMNMGETEIFGSKDTGVDASGRTAYLFFNNTNAVKIIPNSNASGDTILFTPRSEFNKPGGGWLELYYEGNTKTYDNKAHQDYNQKQGPAPIKLTVGMNKKEGDIVTMTSGPHTGKRVKITQLFSQSDPLPDGKQKAIGVIIESVNQGVSESLNENEIVSEINWGKALGTAAALVGSAATSKAKTPSQIKDSPLENLSSKLFSDLSEFTNDFVYIKLSSNGKIENDVDPKTLSEQKQALAEIRLLKEAMQVENNTLREIILNLRDEYSTDVANRLPINAIGRGGLATVARQMTQWSRRNSRQNLVLAINSVKSVQLKLKNLGLEVKKIELVIKKNILTLNGVKEDSEVSVTESLNERASQLLSAEDRNGVITVVVQAPDGTKRSVADANPRYINQWLQMKYGLTLPRNIMAKFVESDLSEAPGDFGLGANYRAIPDDEMQDLMGRSKNKTKTKRDKFDYPYIHGSNIEVKDEAGKRFDTDKLRASIMTRPTSILGQNAKMQHSETGDEAIFDIGLPALKGLAVNEKTGEFVVVDTCPGAGACQTYCYAMKGSYVMFKAVSMGLARMLNFLLNDPEGFATKLNSEIAAAKAKYAKKGARIVVRWHDAGDFFSPEYLDMAYKVAEANPDVGFYAYTKMGDVANAARPRNFNMNFSQGAKTGQEKKVNITRTKHSKVVPKDMFFDLIARKGNELIKDAKGRMQFASPENLDKFKTLMAQKYAIDKDSILTYDQMMKTPVGNEPKWNVIVMPGDGDNSANRNDVIGSYLLFH